MRANLPLARPRRGQVNAHAWEDSSRFWYAYYSVSLAVTLGIVLTSSASVRERSIATAALLAMACWYATVGRRVTTDVQVGARAENAYLAVLLGLFVVAETQTGSSTFILLAVCPQCFSAAVSFRRAVAFVTVFNLVDPVVAAFTLTGPGRRTELADLAGIA